eukprot:354751-Chlamydomonas_euryale.AAC.2
MSRRGGQSDGEERGQSDGVGEEGTPAAPPGPTGASCPPPLRPRHPKQQKRMFAPCHESDRGSVSATGAFSAPRTARVSARCSVRVDAFSSVTCPPGATVSEHCSPTSGCTAWASSSRSSSVANTTCSCGGRTTGVGCGCVAPARSRPAPQARRAPWGGGCGIWGVWAVRACGQCGRVGSEGCVQFGMLAVRGVGSAECGQCGWWSVGSAGCGQCGLLGVGNAAKLVG